MKRTHIFDVSCQQRDSFGNEFWGVIKTRYILNRSCFVNSHFAHPKCKQFTGTKIIWSDSTLNYSAISEKAVPIKREKNCSRQQGFDKTTKTLPNV